MNLRILRIAPVCVLVWFNFAAAQATRPAGLEPGQAEAQQRATTLPLIRQFTSPALEVRGVWLASSSMTAAPDVLRRHLDAIRSANFNTVLIDTYFRGYVAYPGGAVVPQFPDFKGQDVLGLLIDESHRRGLRAELWMEYGFYAYFTSDATKDESMGPILDAHPDLLSINARGDRFIHRSFGDFYSICPSNPKSHEILATIFVEAVSKYPHADGVNLDRIRYADADYCFCNYCKTQFHADTGIELKPFPDASDQARQWLQWKRRQTLKAVRTITQKLRAARPGIVITSYVVGPDEMDSKAQGWDLWMQEGLLDAVAVSMYSADVLPAMQRAIELLGGDRSRLIAALSCAQQTDVYLSNIELARRHGLPGHFTWHFGDLLDDIQPLRHGPHQAPAKSPFQSRDP